MGAEIQEVFTRAERERLVQLLVLDVQSAQAAKKVLSSYTGKGYDEVIHKDIDLVIRLIGLVAP